MHHRGSAPTPPRGIKDACGRGDGIEPVSTAPRAPPENKVLWFPVLPAALPGTSPRPFEKLRLYGGNATRVMPREPFFLVVRGELCSRHHDLESLVTTREALAPPTTCENALCPALWAVTGFTRGSVWGHRLGNKPPYRTPLRTKGMTRKHTRGKGSRSMGVHYGKKAGGENNATHGTHHV